MTEQTNETREKSASRLHGLITHDIRAEGITERFKAFGFIRYERVGDVSRVRILGITVFARVGDKIEFLGVQL